MFEATLQPAFISPASSRATNRAAIRGALVLLLMFATILQHFGINGVLSGTLVMCYGFLGIAGFAGGLLVSTQRLVSYGLCLAIATASFLLNDSLPTGERPSFASLALIAAVYLPFVFSLKPNALAACDAAWVTRVFLNIALVCSVAGILQFCAQFFVHAAWLFDFQPYLPAWMQAPGVHNTVIAMGSQSKANGFFFAEPSGYSFIMALGLLAEAASHRRPWRVACLGLALMLSYSGTGLLTLLVGVLFPIGRKTLQRIFILGTLGGLAVWLLSDALNLSFTIGRIGEFQSERSSAYIRYVAPLRLIADTWHTEGWTFWLGHGPGSIAHPTVPYRFHDPTWAKLLFEYGGLGFVAFVALVLSVLRSTAAAMQVRAALFFSWLVMGGHLLSAEQNFLMLGLVGFVPPMRAKSQPGYS